jgi:hypothetical protein
MAGLAPAIHVFVSRRERQDVDHRDERGDDGFDVDADRFVSSLTLLARTSRPDARR